MQKKLNRVKFSKLLQLKKILRIYYIKKYMFYKVFRKIFNKHSVHNICSVCSWKFIQQQT